MNPLDIDKKCGTVEADLLLEESDPLFGMAREAFEVFATQSRGAGETGIPLIPVVFHVLWKDPIDNVSDAQLISQINVLNWCFRSMNPDRLTGTPDVFKPLIGDAKIQFDLVGITRTQTNKSSFGLNDDAKFDSTGGKNAWPSQQYLNIWVVPAVEQNMYSGYAQFPYGPASTDGIVMNHRYVGTMGTAVPPFHLGRTVIHEVGHWLNLRHIWGDEPGCTGSDGVADTPVQATDNRGIPEFPHISCNNGPNGDLFMNYMDYTWDQVTVMFTKGQCTRMSYGMLNGRSTMLNRLATSDPVPPGEFPVEPPVNTIINLGRGPLSDISLGREPLIPPRRLA